MTPEMILDNLFEKPTTVEAARKMIADAIRAAVVEEREACAKVCEDAASEYVDAAGVEQPKAATCRRLAHSIRARSQV